MSVRTSVRDRITRVFLSDHVTAMEHTIAVMENAYRQGPYLLSEKELVRQLSEADSYLVDYILRQRNYQLLSGAVTSFGEEDRLRAVDEARLMYHYNVQTASAVQMWTDFGFGQSVEVKPRDEVLAEVFDEFWTARRNAPILEQHRIHKLSNAVINDGEVFLVFFSSNIRQAARRSASDNGADAQTDVDRKAKTTIRRLDTKSIARIVYERDDPDIPLFYVRITEDLGEVWYPDWRATPGQLASIKLPRNAKLVTDLGQKIVVGGKQISVTSAKVLHLAYDDVDGRGWPVLGRMYVWARVYRDFMGDRAAVARRAAMFVDEVIHGGGSRATAAIENKFQSSLGTSSWGHDANPPAPAGSTLVHNKAVEVKRRPLDSGAGDAQNDGQMLAGQVSVGTGIPLHWMGWPQALSNRATAKEMRAPWNEQLERYQTFFVAGFQAMVEIVGMNAGGFEDYTTDVSLQSPLDVDVAEIQDLMTAVTDALTAGTVDTALGLLANNALVTRGLMTLGITDVQAALEDNGNEGGTAPDDEEISVTDRVVLAALADNLQDGTITAEQAADYLRRELVAELQSGGTDNGKNDRTVVKG